MGYLEAENWNYLHSSSPQGVIYIFVSVNKKKKEKRMEQSVICLFQHAGSIIPYFLSYTICTYCFQNRKRPPS